MLSNLPNILTLSRIAVIPLLVILMYVPTLWAAWTATALFTLAAITDYLDGYVARAYAQVSVIGKFLDPIADKLMVSAALFLLVGTGRLSGVMIFPSVVILLREVMVSGLREYLAELRISIPTTRLAKWKTTVQLVSLGFLIAGDAAKPLMAQMIGQPLMAQMIGEAGLSLAAVLTLITGWHYLQAGLKHMRAIEPDRQ